MRKILIIEDDVTLREELCLLLENGGYAPCVTVDFENAADEAGQDPAGSCSAGYPSAGRQRAVHSPGNPFQVGCSCDYADKPKYRC